jgi:hypothetical protein
MKPKNHTLTCILTTLIFACPVFSQTDSNRPDIRLSGDPINVLADVNSVWISIYKTKTPGRPYIPDPCLDHQIIQEKLKSAGIERVSVPLLNRNPDSPLPANLRFKIYIHNYDPSEPYIFYIEIAIARPVVITSIMDSPFYAEVWHSKGVIDTSSEQDLQEKINKAVIDQLGDMVRASKIKKSVYSNYPSSKDPNQPSPKLSK